MEDKFMTYFINYTMNNGITDCVELDNLEDVKHYYDEMCYYYGHDNIIVEDSNGAIVEL